MRIRPHFATLFYVIIGILSTCDAFRCLFEAIVPAIFVPFIRCIWFKMQKQKQPTVLYRTRHLNAQKTNHERETRRGRRRKDKERERTRKSFNHRRNFSSKSEQHQQQSQ